MRSEVRPRTMADGEHESMQLAVGETLSRPIRATPEETTGPSRGPTIPLREAPIAKRWRGCSREPTDDERRRGGQQVRQGRTTAGKKAGPVTCGTSHTYGWEALSHSSWSAARRWRRMARAALESGSFPDDASP
eukprot:scaffold24679_cov101-Isochrysis_galbana.AAC.1